ncbi:MAG: AI-2E family transporter [Pseudoflavonifractor sp.]|nr:AI-2E family transporter [Pseudoflavonifractor sp.]
MHKQKWYHLDSRSLSNLVVVCVGILLYLGLTHLPQVRTAIHSFLTVLSPFIFGFMIAYLLNTPTNFFERKVYHRLKCRRTLSILTVFLLTIAVIVFLLQLVLPQVFNSIFNLMNNMSYYMENMDQIIREIVQRFDLGGKGLADLMSSYNEILQKATDFLKAAVPNILNFGMAVGNGVITGVTAVIASIYMLGGKTRLTGQLKKLIYALFPANGVSNILRVCGKANQVFVGFINGKLIDSAIIGVLCFLLSTAIRTPYAVLLSVIIGVTNIIPFFGPIIGAVPCLMILILVDPWAALRFGILVVALQQFDGNVLGPKILGDSTGLSAIWVLVSIVVGGGLFGFPGMLLGVPTFAVLYSLMREWADARLAKKGIDANGDPVSPPRVDGQEPDTVPED